MTDVAVADTVEIPTRIWRVQYVDRRLSTDEDSDPKVIWFETEKGFKTFIAEAWMDGQLNRVEQRVIQSAHRVLVESTAPVKFEIDVGVRVEL